ncbi:transposase [Streptomyces sp. NPDC055013]
MLSWQTDRRTVSIWTVQGRMKGLPYTGQEDQLQLLADRRQGESDLLHQNGRWYLLATIDVPEPPQNPAPQGFIGVDLGIENIATTSTGRRHSGRHTNRTRENDRRLQRNLAKKNTRSAKRRAKRHAGK